MSDVGVKKWYPLSPTQIILYIDEFETYLDEINGESPCLFKIVVTILLYANNVILYLNREEAYKEFF